MTRPVGFRSPSPLRERFAAARRDLSAALIERDQEVDLALTALLAGEHLLLVGPPGCAKSPLLDSLLRFVDGRKFSILLTKFTTPEEVAGPLSLAALKEGRYRRITAGRLPEAHLAFLDEVFKASSAILNTLLRLLNEGTFEDDGAIVPVPLRLCLAASNEWPAPETGQELAAILDRFLFRRAVRPIATAAGRERLLWGDDPDPRPSTPITPAELDAARAEARATPWSAAAREALTAILAELAREGVAPGDRRKKKAVAAARAYAYLGGAERVEPEHLEVRAAVLWDDPIEQPETAARIIARVANPAGMRVHGLLLEVESILAAVDVRDLAQAATAAAKLGEVDKQLAALEHDPRGARARAYVREQVKRIRLGSIEAL
jgi:MoxR-like ATPase